MTAKPELSDVEWKVLLAAAHCMVTHDDVALVRQIAAVCGLTEAEVEATMNGLADKGLVQRVEPGRAN